MAVPARPEAPFSLAASPFTKRLEGRVLRFIQQRHVLSPGERVVVAVSGGPDSTALLVLLSRLRSFLGIDITVAHFDHMLRNRLEVADDRSFVDNLADLLNLPLVTGRADVRARARRARESIEDAARRLRYAFLARAAKQTGSSAVVAGHTLDDRAETVLLHLLRGSGLDGLIGMRPRSPWPFGNGPAVARPLLDLRREDAGRYCLELGIVPQHDPTNDLPVATRNRIRHQLLPALREFNPRVEEALARLADNAEMDTDLLESIAEDTWRGLAACANGRVSFARVDLAALHPAITNRLIRHTVAHLLGSPADLEATHIDQIRASLAKRHSRLSLPHGLTAVMDARSLSIASGSLKSAPPIPETTLAVPGSTHVDRWLVEAEFVPPPGSLPKTGDLEAYLDAEAVGVDIIVRSRRPGDRLRPLGLRGEKKVQDILVDAKVPAEERDSVPLVLENNGVVWVVGHRIDERYALHPYSVTALRLRFTLCGSSPRQTGASASDLVQIHRATPYYA